MCFIFRIFVEKISKSLCSNLILLNVIAQDRLAPRLLPKLLFSTPNALNSTVPGGDPTDTPTLKSI